MSGADSPPAGEAAPLSLGQERLWFLDRFDPGDPAYNMHITQRLRGPFDLAALRTALTTVVARHASLRTRFPSQDGRPVAVTDPPRPVPVEVIDTSTDPDPERRAGTLVAERVNRGFDLAAGPLLRATVLRLSAEDHVLSVVQHHIIGDGWSQELFRGELHTVYRALRAGVEPDLTPLTHHYTDFVRWQRERLSGSAHDAALRYWTERLTEAPVLDLPGDRPAPPVRTSAGDFWNRKLPGPVAEAVERFARREGVTLYMTLLAVYQVLLLRHTGQDDLCVGSPVAGRSRVEFEPVIGFFANTVVLRGDLSGNPTFRQLLRRTRDTVLDAFDHQDVPFEHLLANLGVARDLSRNPLFQTMFVLHSSGATGGDRLALGELSVDGFDEGFRQAKFDLMLEAWRRTDRLQLVFGYSTDRFDETTVARIAHRYETLLLAAVAAPDTPVLDLAVLPAWERDLLHDWSRAADEAAEHPGVPDLVAATARRQPDAPAVRCGAEVVTYRELLDRADVLAARLVGAGVRPGDVVGVCLPRSVTAVAALLAVWRAGAAYLPLDPAYPAARLELMVHDSGTRLVLTESVHSGRLPAGTALCRTDTDPGPVGDVVLPGPGEDAYVVYTSGTTGRPKGVVVPHRALADRVAWMCAAYELTPADRVLHAAALSFDTHAEELYPALAAGACLAVAPPDEPLPDLFRSVAGAALTVVDLPTSYWHRLVDDGIGWPAALRLVILGADQARADAVTAWFAARDVPLVNTYGPTEATVIATAAWLAPDGTRPPIGRPLGGARAYVLDGRGRPAPVGVVGELHLGGAGLAHGYLHDPAATAAAFGPDPFVAGPGARMYRTGDLARWRADGQLEFVGRRDDQVKVRGYRVEPGEVAATLRSRPSIVDAVVVTDATGDSLVGYVVPAPDAAPPDPVALRRDLAATLPAYLVPGVVVLLDRLPLSPSGKLDRAALPVPGRPDPTDTYTAPRTAIEELVAGVWAAVLGLDKVGVFDDFFAVGGHSLLATRVVARLGAAVDLEVPVKALFTHPTVAAFADAVEHLLIADLDRLTDAEAAARLTDAPPSPPED
jgi:amino acid adenylation domain-containing protein